MWFNRPALSFYSDRQTRDVVCLVEPGTAAVANANTFADSISKSQPNRVPNTRSRARAGADRDTVSDIGMPQEDGYGLISRLRKLKSARAKQIPALALTAYATDEDRSRAISAGFQIHLSKRIEPESLVSSIAAALGVSS
jgi:CheY-like chemotaxis protein